jgi:hypothetical protein
MFSISVNASCHTLLLLRSQGRLSKKSAKILGFQKDVSEDGCQLAGIFYIDECVQITEEYE